MSCPLLWSSVDLCSETKRHTWWKNHKEKRWKALKCRSHDFHIQCLAQKARTFPARSQCSQTAQSKCVILQRWKPTEEPSRRTCRTTWRTIIKCLLLVKRRVRRGRRRALCSSRDSRWLTSNQIIKWQRGEQLRPPTPATPRLIGWLADTSASAAVESDWPRPAVSVSGGKWSFSRWHFDTLEGWEQREVKTEGAPSLSASSAASTTTLMQDMEMADWRQICCGFHHTSVSLSRNFDLTLTRDNTILFFRLFERTNCFRRVEFTIQWSANAVQREKLKSFNPTLEFLVHDAQQWINLSVPLQSQFNFVNLSNVGNLWNF